LLTDDSDDAPQAQQSVPAGHDERRQQIAALSCRLIASRGLDGLTIRTVAAEIGFSTAVITHYFHNKRDLLRHTYEFAASRAVSREGNSHAYPADLWEYLSAILPIDEIAIENWRVFIAFWGAAYGDPELADRQRYFVRAARDDITERLPPYTGELSLVMREELSRRLLATLMGIATQAAFDPEEWPATRQLRSLSGVFDALLQRP
jgi:AcrR family transcriptional regulator